MDDIDFKPVYNYFTSNCKHMFQMTDYKLKYKSDILDQFNTIIEHCENGFINDWITFKKGYVSIIIIMSIFMKYKYLSTDKMYMYDIKTIYFIEMGFEDYYKELNIYEKLLIINVYSISNKISDLLIAKDLLAKCIKTPLVLKYIHKVNKNIVILTKFNRYPSRNIYLNRLSTLDEVDYLDTLL